MHSAIAWTLQFAMSSVLTLEGTPVQNDSLMTIHLKRENIPLHRSSRGVVQHKSAYYGQIAVGGPVQQLMEVVFDTGSGHIVLPSAVCQTRSCLSHRRYRRKASLFATDIEANGSAVAPHTMRDQLTVQYGTGEVTGIFVRDYVCLGSPAQLRTAVHEQVSVASGPNISMPVNGCALMQVVYAVDMTDEPFAAFSFDGIVGLGLQGLSSTPEFNFFTSLTRGAFWKPFLGFEYCFTVFLAVSDEEQSEITFGGWRSLRMKQPGKFSWHEVMDPDMGYWQIQIDEVWADGRKVAYCDDGRCRAIVDTGTSILGVPRAVGPEITAGLRHRASENHSCSGDLPELEFVLRVPGGHATVKLGPSDYARPELDFSGSDGPGRARPYGGSAESDSGLPSQSAVVVKQGGMCVPMLMYLSLEEPLSEKTFLFGEPILQRYYTAFDANPRSPRIGFSEAHHVSPREPLHIFT